MMNGRTKFLFYTDLHLSAKRPIHRVDDFATSLLVKLAEVYDIAKQEDVDFVLFGGDFFNNHRIFNYDIIRTASDIMERSGKKTFAVIGQHDLIGHNQETYKTSTLAFLEHFCRSYQTLVKPFDAGNKVTIYPCHWFDNVKEMVQKSPASGTSVMVCHQTIVKDKLPYNAILTSELTSDYDVIISGDVHAGFDPHRIGKTTFYNPSSLVRRAVNEIHDPKVGVIEVGGNKPVSIKDVKLKNVVKTEDAFGVSLTEIVKVAAEDVTTERFVEGILELEQSAVDVFDLITKIASMKGTRQEVIDYIVSKRK